MTLDNQIKCVGREIRMREVVYPKWVASKKMKPENASYEIDTMKAVLATLKKLKAIEDAAVTDANQTRFEGQQ